MDKTTRNWVLDNEGYHVFRKKNDPKAVTKIKSRIVPIEVNVKTPVGKKIKKTSEQKQVAIHSLKREHKALETIERKRRASEKVLEKSDYPAKALKDSNRYVDTSEVDKDAMKLDEERIKDELEGVGYFMLTTSELNMPAGTILRLYRDKNAIEHAFRTLKSVLHIRPVYVYTPEHIVSHIEPDVISLQVLTLMTDTIEKKTAKKVPAETLQDELKNLFVVPIYKDIIIIPELSVPLKHLTDAYGIQFNCEYMYLKTLKLSFYP